MNVSRDHGSTVIHHWKKTQEVAMYRHQLVPFLALLLALGAATAPLCHAAWQTNGAPVCLAANDQQYPAIASDGAAGAIVAWYDKRNGTDYDIYVQRLSVAGVPQWAPGGVLLCAAANDQQSPTVVSDGAGGAIVTWYDFRTGTDNDIYVQRVDAAGAAQWALGGVPICVAANDQTEPMIVSDDAGGAIVTWYDKRNGTDYDIYVQRVNAAGARQWSVGGVPLCAAAQSQEYPTIVADGGGGAIVAWQDYRAGISDVYVQRVSAAGVPQWTADGVALCTEPNYQFIMPGRAIVPDGTGGAIVTWFDGRSGTNYDIYARRVSAAGVPLWTADGVALCTAANEQRSAAIVSDAAGGAIVTWYDKRSGTNYDIYAQRVSPAGAPQWAADGVALCTAANDQEFPVGIPDGVGGAIVTWQDSRDGSPDVYVQRVSAAGAPQWTADGVALCTAADDQSFPTIVASGPEGATVAWRDLRSGTDYDIYAQRIHVSGAVADVPSKGAAAHFQLLSPYPNPTRGGELRIRFTLPSSNRVSAQVLDVAGHRVRTLAAEREFSPGTQVLSWDGESDAHVRQPSGVYLVQLRVGTHSEVRRAILLR